MPATHTPAPAHYLARRMALLGVPFDQASSLARGEKMICADGSKCAASPFALRKADLATAEGMAAIYFNYRRPHTVRLCAAIAKATAQ